MALQTPRSVPGDAGGSAIARSPKVDFDRTRVAMEPHDLGLVRKRVVRRAMGHLTQPQKYRCGRYTNAGPLEGPRWS